MATNPGPIAPPPITGTTYYVSPTGSDSNNGTSTGTPWQTLTKVNAILPTLSAGDAVLLQGGQTFTGSIGVFGATGGSTAHPITIGSYGGSNATLSAASSTETLTLYNTSGWVVRDLNFNGNTATGTAAVYLGVDGTVLTRNKDIWLYNLSWLNYHYAGAWLGGDGGNGNGFDNVNLSGLTINNCGIAFQVYGPGGHTNKAHTGLTIDNVVGHDCLTDGIQIGSVDGGVVQWCETYNNGATGTGGPVGVWTYDCNNVLVQYCESHHNLTGGTGDGDGFDIDGGCTNCVVQFCYAHDNYGAGIQAGSYPGGPMSGNTIRYNICENNCTNTFDGEIYIFSSASDAVSGLNIYCNTLYNADGAGVITGDAGLNSGVTSINIANNLCVAGGTSTQVKFGGSSVGVTFTNNLHYGTQGYLLNGTTYSTLALWQAAVSASSIGSNPLLPGAGGVGTIHGFSAALLAAGYEPGSGSPALTSGANLVTLLGVTLPATDVFGFSTTALAIGAGGRPLAYTLSAASGAYALTGSAVSLKRNPRLTASSGSYALTGTAVALKRNRRLVAATQAYTLSGTSVALKRNLRLVSSSSTYVLSGTAVALKRSRIMATATTAYALTGTAVVFRKGRAMAAASGSYTLTGSALGFPRGRVLAASTQSYALTGAATGLLLGHRMQAASGAYILSGTAGLLRRGYPLTAATGSYSLSGTAVALSRPRSLVATSTSYSLTGAALAMRVAHRLPAASGSYVLTGAAVALTKVGASTMAAASGAYLLSETPASLRRSRLMTAASGSFALTGTPDALRWARRLAAVSAGFDLTGSPATLRLRHALSASAGAYSLSGQIVTLGRTRRLLADTASLNLLGSDVVFIWQRSNLFSSPKHTAFSLPRSRGASSLTRSRTAYSER